jgi:hypothetical protein
MTDPAPEQTSSDETPEEPAASTEDDVKRKFREALERKRNPNGEAQGGAGGKNSSKVRGVHGSAANQKSFRRKSG